MCGPRFGSLRITQDVQAYVAERGLGDPEALAEGLRARATEFNAPGGRRYLPVSHRDTA